MQRHSLIFAQLTNVSLEPKMAPEGWHSMAIRKDTKRLRPITPKPTGLKFLERSVVQRIQISLTSPVTDVG